MNKHKKKTKIKRERKKINIDFNSIFGGMFVGIANIIPGVSGGTMLVIFNLFDKLTYAVSDIFKRKTDTRKQSILLLAKVLISAAIGIILFAKILGFTLKYFEAETIMCFMGLILFSVPIIIKEELKNEKFNILFFIIGFALIIGLEYLQKNTFSNDANASMNLAHFSTMCGLGVIGGATMIFPGISGSMVMLVLGKYELIRGYIDSLTSFDKDYLEELGLLKMDFLALKNLTTLDSILKEANIINNDAMILAKQKISLNNFIIYHKNSKPFFPITSRIFLYYIPKTYLYFVIDKYTIRIYNQ